LRIPIIVASGQSEGRDPRHTITVNGFDFALKVHWAYLKFDEKLPSQCDQGGRLSKIRRLQKLDDFLKSISSKSGTEYFLYGIINALETAEKRPE